jgi:hypothetical protein
MRGPLIFSELWRPAGRAGRVALGAAVVAMAVIAACTDNTKTITAPQSPRAATTGSGDFSQEMQLKLCVDGSSPNTNYTFRNDELNRNVAQDSYSNPLSGNGFWDGTYWNDPGDGGNGTTVANALEDVPYTVAAGGCITVLTRTIPDAAFLAKIPIGDPSGLGTCDPNTSSCGGVNDSFAAANILYVSNPLGAVYDHTDCYLDDGVLMPQHINPTTGNPPVAINPWPQGGFNHNNPPANYDCGSSNNPTRAFVNFEHGATITFFFVAGPSTGIIAPTATTCEEYAKGTASTLDNILVGYKGIDINSVSPGVFFYYARVTKGAGQPVGFIQFVSPNPANLPLYEVKQTQAYLYRFNGSSCTTVATLSLTNGGTAASGGASLPAGNYILGVKFGTDAPKGVTVSNASLRASGALLATHNYEATINGIGNPTTSASVDTRSK